MWVEFKLILPLRVKFSTIQVVDGPVLTRCSMMHPHVQVSPFGKTLDVIEGKLLKT